MSLFFPQLQKKNCVPRHNSIPELATQVKWIIFCRVTCSWVLWFVFWNFSSLGSDIGLCFGSKVEHEDLHTAFQLLGTLRRSSCHSWDFSSAGSQPPNGADGRNRGLTSGNRWQERRPLRKRYFSTRIPKVWWTSTVKLNAFLSVLWWIELCSPKILVEILTSSTWEWNLI